MLILTRRVGEKIFLGDNVQVVVLGVNGSQVRMGFVAPSDIAVHRDEVYHRIKREEACASAIELAAATTTHEHRILQKLEAIRKKAFPKTEEKNYV